MLQEDVEGNAEDGAEEDAEGDTEEDAEGDAEDGAEEDAEEDPEINLKFVNCAINYVFFMFAGAMTSLEFEMQGIDKGYFCIY